MTDFLTGLTARSFGAVTAIRPRLASLFEPAHNGQTALEAAPPEQIVTAVASEVEAASDGERQTRPVPALLKDGRRNDAKRASNVLDDERGEQQDPVVAAQGRSFSLRSDSEDDASSRTSIHADETRQQEDPVIAVKVRPRRTLLSQAENSDVSHPLSFVRSDLRPPLEESTPKRVPAEAPGASPPRDDSSEVNNRGLVLPPKVVSELIAQMKNAASGINAGSGTPAREKARSASPALAAEPEPSVHVTIGRIEVRATSDSKPVGRPRAASPVMSLEDYLHRRTQRGDR